MSIKTKAVKIMLDEKEYGMILDFEAAIEFQDLSGMSLFEGLDIIGKTQDLKVLCYFLAACLKDADGNAVGLEFVKKLDIFSSLNEFMEAFTALVDNSLEKSDSIVKKKKKMI